MAGAMTRRKAISRIGGLVAAACADRQRSDAANAEPAKTDLSDAQPSKNAPVPGWLLLFEPLYKHHPTGELISGSKATVATPAELATNGTLRFPKQLSDLPDGWRNHAIRNGERIYSLLRKNPVRTKGEVVTHMILHGDARLPVTPAFFSPSVLAALEELFGTTPRFVVPSREVAFVFPSIGRPPEELAGPILHVWDRAIHRVSLEVITWSATDGHRAIGTYEA
jgi:hypothetical protein